MNRKLNKLILNRFKARKGKDFKINLKKLMKKFKIRNGLKILEKYFKNFKRFYEF